MHSWRSLMKTLLSEGACCRPPPSLSSPSLLEKTVPLEERSIASSEARRGLPSKPRVDTCVTLQFNRSPTWDDELGDEFFTY